MDINWNLKHNIWDRWKLRVEVVRSWESGKKIKFKVGKTEKFYFSIKLNIFLNLFKHDKLDNLSTRTILSSYIFNFCNLSNTSNNFHTSNFFNFSKFPIF